MYKSKFNQLYNQIITQMAKLATNTNKKLLEYKTVETQYNKLMNQYNDLINKSKQAETKILQLHPQLSKRIERVKLNPKEGWQADQKLHVNKTEHGDIYTGSMYQPNLVSTFGMSLNRAYELNKNIQRLKTKLDTLKLQLGDLINAQAVDITANLPQEFIDVLEQLRQYIINIYTTRKQTTVKNATLTAANPVKAQLQKYLADPIAYQKFYGADKADKFKYVSEHIANINEATDAEIIPLYIQSYIDYLKRLHKTNQLEQAAIDYATAAANKAIEIMKNNANSTLIAANNINPTAQGNQVFENIKAQFLDKLSEYCTKIISAEDVSLGDDGSINGIVHAQNGIFHVRTIQAGGYNIQRLHFRVIITPLNEKNYQKLKNSNLY